MDQQFTFQTYLPIKQKYLRFRSFDGRTHLMLGKFIQNDDNESIINTFESIIKTCCTEHIEVDKLSSVDMFCILLNLRIMCISQTFDFEATVTKSTESVKKTQKLDLYDILDKITNHPSGYIQQIKTQEGYDVTLGVPTGMRVMSVDELMVNVVDSIKIAEKSYNLRHLSFDEKTTILDNLPGDVLTYITNYLKRMDHECRIKVFEFIQTGDLANIELKLFDNSLFEFIKAMYNCNLQEQYYIRYLMVKRLGFNLRDVEDITPIDTTNYINLYREELEEERKANEKQSGKQNTGMSLPNPGFEQ